jgi:pimeloyl-ACP methyl ester carboxylesterase
MTIEHSAWAGMVTVDDTALYVTDTGGLGRPVVYLNGAYADQSHWRRVIADLGSDYRHITFDERARAGRHPSTVRMRQHDNPSLDGTPANIPRRVVGAAGGRTSSLPA